jgi:SagB-type dehydrogenase family enzyme
VTRLAPRTAPLSVDLVSMVEERQTRRDFKDVLDEQFLGQLLWLSCRSRSSWHSEYGFDQESRPAPSAGALHPVHVLVGAEGLAWQRYDAVAHSLVEVPRSEANVTAMRTAASNLVDLGRGALVSFLAEPGRTGAKYESPDSLVWRDAGVLLGYMSVAAEALGLSFCPLGLTGDAVLRDLLDWSAPVHGAGLAVVGRA